MGGEGDDRGWGGLMSSLTQWTWVWADSRSLWWTGRPGMLWFMGEKKLDTAELNWTEVNWLNYILYGKQYGVFHTHTQTYTKAKYRTTIWSSNFTSGYFIFFIFNGNAAWTFLHNNVLRCTWGLIVWGLPYLWMFQIKGCFFSDLLLGTIKQFFIIGGLV